MSPRKTLLELVQERAFRPDRHRRLIFHDDDTIERLLNAVDRGECEIPRSEYIRLSWCAYYAEGWYRGRLFEPMAALRFMQAMRGDCPPHAAEPGGWDT